MTKKLLGVLLLPALFVAPALAASNDPATIKGCVDKKGALRIANTCKKGEKALSWNQQGAPGPAGPQGPAAPEKATTALSGSVKLDGIGDVDVTTFAINAKNTPTEAGGGGGAGKVAFGNVRFTKKFDAASPKLMLRTATGQHLASALFTLGAFTYKLSDVQVVSFDQDETETIELDFAKVEVTVGGVTTGWDIKANKSI